LTAIEACPDSNIVSAHIWYVLNPHVPGGPDLGRTLCCCLGGYRYEDLRCKSL